MITFYRLLMAGTFLSNVVSVQMAEAGIANGAPARDIVAPATLIILAQAVEPEKKREAVPPKQPPAPANTPAVAPVPPPAKPATPPAPAKPPERVAPPAASPQTPPPP